MSLSRVSRLTRKVLAGSGGRPTFAYVSYHKCATQFTERVLRGVCRLHGLSARTFDSRHARVGDRAVRRTDFLMLTDYSSSMLDLATLGARGVYVIRDPRDILVSMYFSHRFSHPINHEEIGRNRRALASLEVEPGLAYLMDESRFFARIVEEMERWESRGLRYFETTFERLTADPPAEFGRMLTAIGLPTGQTELLDIVERNRFARLREEWRNRNPGVDVNHYRGEGAGGWRTHLVGAVRDRFRERHGDLLVALGYERDTDW